LILISSEAHGSAAISLTTCAFRRIGYALIVGDIAGRGFVRAVDAHYAHNTQNAV
jgi:hypothetical protein